MRLAYHPTTPDQLDRGSCVKSFATPDQLERNFYAKSSATPDRLSGRFDSSRAEEACVPALDLCSDCASIANTIERAGDSNTLRRLFSASSIVCELSRTTGHSHHLKDRACTGVHQLECQCGGAVCDAALSGDCDGATLRVGPGVRGNSHYVDVIAHDHDVL